MASRNNATISPDVKTCTVCGQEYVRRQGYGQRQWQASTTCSRNCSAAKVNAARVWPSLGARFAAKVNMAPGQGPAGECHEWQGHRIKWGYGSFRVGRDIKKAHRVAYQLANGPIPEGMIVRHLCDNPPCCNPKHLQLGTHTENMADMIANGRKRNRGDGLLPRVDPLDPKSMPIPGRV